MNEVNSFALLPVPAISDAVTDIVDAGALPQLAARINEAVNGVEHHAGLAVQHALTAGKLLLEAKAQVEHGQWATWLADNCQVAARTARAYMRLAEKLSELPAAEWRRVAALPLRQALRAIATDPKARPRFPRRHEGDEWDRAAATFGACESSLRRAANRMRKVRSGDGLPVRAIRQKLQAALDALDRITQVTTVDAKQD